MKYGSIEGERSEWKTEKFSFPFENPFFILSGNWIVKIISIKHNQQIIFIMLYYLEIPFANLEMKTCMLHKHNT